MSISDAALPWVLSGGVTVAILAGAALAAAADRWYCRRLVRHLRCTQRDVVRRFPAHEAAERNAALQRTIDILESR